MNIPEDNKYFHYYNANPKGKNSKDCTYRALSLFLDKSWDDIARMDAEFYLEHGMWLFTTELVRYSYQNRVDVFLEKLSYTPIYRHGQDGSIGTLREFIDKYASDKKVYLCEMHGHMAAIKDRKVWDTWDSSEHCPNMIFERAI